MARLIECSFKNLVIFINKNVKEHIHMVVASEKMVFFSKVVLLKYFALVQVRNIRLKEL